MNRLFYDSIGAGPSGAGEIPESFQKWVENEAPNNLKKISDEWTPADATTVYGYSLRNWIAGAIAAYRHLSLSPGLRWVKASERLPEDDGMLYVKVIYKNKEERKFSHFVASQFFIGSWAVWPGKHIDIEWLDESPSLPGEQGEALAALLKSDPTVGELVDQSLKMGVVPIIRFEDKPGLEKGEQVEGRPTIGESLEKVLNAQHTPGISSVEADQQVPEELPIALKAHLDEMMSPYHNRISYRAGAIECYAVLRQEIATLRSGGQSAGEQYRRELQEVKAERDEYRGVVERLEKHTRSIPKANRLVKAFLNKFTNNTTAP